MKSKNYRRDSFDIRVCDDLCEVILQFLSLEDKLKLESVSKQFKRTLFCSQRTLSIDFTKSEIISNKNLEILLQKLPWITSVQYNYYLLPTLFMPNPEPNLKSDPNLNEATELIIKCCNNLTHIDSYTFSLIEKHIIIEFFEKFGHKLLSAVLNTHFLWFLNKMPEIEELKVNNITDDNYLPDIHLKRLKKFAFDLRLDMDLNNFKVFIQRNAETITHLDINRNWMDEPQHHYYKELLTIVSNLKNLVHLKIWSEFCINDNLFAKQLTQIAVNCNQLKSLAISYKLELKDDTNVDHFSPLIQFKRLKRLDLHFVKESDSLSDSLKSNQFFPFKELKPLSELTQISFLIDDFSYDWSELSQTILTDIDINFPKLQSLIIGMNMNISEQIVVILSRMTELQSIELFLDNDEDIEEISSQLYKNCKKLRKLEIN